MDFRSDVKKLGFRINRLNRCFCWNTGWEVRGGEESYLRLTLFFDRVFIRTRSMIAIHKDHCAQCFELSGVRKSSTERPRRRGVRRERVGESRVACDTVRSACRYAVRGRVRQQDQDGV